jgi:hypothetical protein
MHAKTLAPVLSIVLLCVALAGCASTSLVTPVGRDTYKIVRQAGTGLTRNTEKLEEQARTDAAKFCEEHGKKMKIVSLTSERPMYATGYATTELVFKALDASDPELTSPAPAPVATAMTSPPAEGSAPASPVAAAPATSTDDLYNELMKLDELRQKGILTEKEFQAEKKKILSRSR